MTSAFPLHQYTFEQYVELERESSVKHEFLEGETHAMAGGTLSHRSHAIDVWTREGSECTHLAASAGKQVHIEPIGCVLDVARVYAAAEEPAR